MSDKKYNFVVYVNLELADVVNEDACIQKMDCNSPPASKADV